MRSSGQNEIFLIAFVLLRLSLMSTNWLLRLLETIAFAQKAEIVYDSYIM